jgi:hypothetical protein
MSVRLHRTAFEYAKELITQGYVVADERDAWSEHQPSAQQENEFIRQHGIDAYGKWHRGVDDAEPPPTKKHYKFPYGGLCERAPLRRAHGREPRRTIQAPGYRECGCAPARDDRRPRAQSTLRSN